MANSRSQKRRRIVGSLSYFWRKQPETTTGQSLCTRVNRANDYEFGSHDSALLDEEYQLWFLRLPSDRTPGASPNQRLLALPATQRLRAAVGLQVGDAASAPPGPGPPGNRGTATRVCNSCRSSLKLELGQPAVANERQDGRATILVSLAITLSNTTPKRVTSAEAATVTRAPRHFYKQVGGARVRAPLRPLRAPLIEGVEGDVHKIGRLQESVLGP